MEVRLRQRPGLHPILDHLLVGVRALLQQVEQRKRGLALSEILSQRLPQPVSVRGIIERVVGELEGHAEMLAESEQGRLLVGGRVSNDRADTARRRDQACRLVLHDPPVFELGDLRVAVVIELQHLAFGHLPAGFGEDFIDRLVPEPDDLADRLGIEVVTHQDADLVAPHLAGGLPASAQVRIIHHVVVQERGGMNVLDQAAQDEMIFRAVAAESRAEQEKKGTDALAPAAQNVSRDRIDEGHRGIEVLADLVLDPLQFVSVGVPHVRHRVDGRGCGPVLHAGDTRGGATLCQAWDGASGTAHGFPHLGFREWSPVRLRGSPNFSSPRPGRTVGA